MITLDIDITKADLSTLVEKAIGGQEVIISKDGKPLVKIVPVSLKKPIFGSAKGLIAIYDDFDLPLEDFETYSI